MSEIARAAALVGQADGLFIGAGAGMGVDSGLPDFRGDQGFWKAYPPFEKLGLTFYDLANPQWFFTDPELAWGFYGHRLNLYRTTKPHSGFEVLRRWGTELGRSFVFTSNVDGQFQRAAFGDDELLECHGSIHHLQCRRRCDGSIWDADVAIEVDENFRAKPPLPRCPTCGEIARPNILMFGDLGWREDRSAEQQAQMQNWVRTVKRPAVIELGAGTAVPSVRYQCERVAAAFGVPLIRINPREAHGPAGTVSIAAGAAEALARIDEALAGAS